MKNKNLSLESDVTELMEKIREGRRSGEIKKNQVSVRALGMLNRLSSDEHRFVPRKIKKIKELYEFSHYEMQHQFQHYKSRTWQQLNEFLGLYGLPEINLPEEYKPDPLHR